MQYFEHIWNFTLESDIYRINFNLGVWEGEIITLTTSDNSYKFCSSLFIACFMLFLFLAKNQEKKGEIQSDKHVY